MYIVATLGPRTVGEKQIVDMINEGVNAFRINLSHMDKETIIKVVKFIKLQYPSIRIIGDLTGKKIRVSDMLEENFKIYKKERLVFCSEEDYFNLNHIFLERNIKVVPLNISSDLVNHITTKSIFVKDGRYEIKVLEKKGSILNCEAVNSLYITKGKSCTIAGIDRDKMSIPKRDVDDIQFLIDNKIDIVLLSFISSQLDVQEYKKIIYKKTKEAKRDIEIWAKIETKEGVNNIKKISDEIDTIVFGRGDMVAEGGLINLPIYQWGVCRDLYNSGKKLIVATDLMESVAIKGKPSIAEMNDIFIMVKNGVTGFLLASETTVQNNSIESVRNIVRASKYYHSIIKKKV